MKSVRVEVSFPTSRNRTLKLGLPASVNVLFKTSPPQPPRHLSKHNHHSKELLPSLDVLPMIFMQTLAAMRVPSHFPRESI